MPPTDRELMQKALEALELLARCEHPLTKIQVRKPRDGGSIVTVYPHQVATDAAEPLRERLAQSLRTHWEGCEEVHPECKQPEQEPVAWSHNYIEGNVIKHRPADLDRHPERWTALYTAPPQRKPLTDEEALELWNKHEKHWRFENNALAFTRAIEAAHGIKEQS